jgi:hypothetical protein
MKLATWISASLLFTTSAALAACGGGNGGGGSAASTTCTSDAQCGAGRQCVFSTSSAPTTAPRDFHDEEGFGGSSGEGGSDSFGGSSGDPGVGGASGDGSGGSGDPGSGGSGTPSGTCQPVSGSGGNGGSGGSGGSSGSSGTGGGTSCNSDFLTGSTFYKGDVAFGQCDDPAHPQNCQFGYFIKTSDGCVCTAPCNSGELPKIGEACSQDGSWTCQTLQNSSGTYDLCTHSGLNLCQAG